MVGPNSPSIWEPKIGSCEFKNLSLVSLDNMMSPALGVWGNRSDFRWMKAQLQHWGNIRKITTQPETWSQNQTPKQNKSTQICEKQQKEHFRSHLYKINRIVFSFQPIKKCSRKKQMTTEKVEYQNQNLKKKIETEKKENQELVLWGLKRWLSS